MAWAIELSSSLEHFVFSIPCFIGQAFRKLFPIWGQLFAKPWVFIGLKKVVKTSSCLGGPSQKILLDLRLTTFLFWYFNMPYPKPPKNLLCIEPSLAKCPKNLLAKLLFKTFKGWSNKHLSTWHLFHANPDPKIAGILICKASGQTLRKPWIQTFGWVYKKAWKLRGQIQPSGLITLLKRSGIMFGPILSAKASARRLASWICLLAFLGCFIFNFGFAWLSQD